MKKILFSLMLSISICFIFPMIVSASNTIGSVNNYLQREDFYNQINVERNASATIADAGEEAISTYNGAVAFTKQELNLPGKGGHNLVVERSFNSAQNLNADGRSSVYSVTTKAASGETSESIKYAFKYFLNGDITTEPLYIVFDSVYDMLQAENGSNTICLSENYEENLVDFGYSTNSGFGSSYFWSLEGNNTIGMDLDSYVIAFENAESGSLEFIRDVTLPYGEVYTTSHFSYMYNHKYSRNLDSYIGLGWEYKMPMLQSVDDGWVSTTSSSEIYELTGCFYDPEWGYALDLYIKYTIPNRYPDRTQINKAYLYDPSSYDAGDGKSNLYTADFIRLDENGDILLSVIITRKDGKQFVFEDYEILKEVKDSFGNSINYDYDYINDIVYITDTLNRDVVLSPEGITLNGDTVVEYIKTDTNNDYVDPNENFDEDNRYTFKARYDVDSNNQKEVIYEIKPGGRTIVLADTDQEVNNHYNPERQTLAVDKLLIENVTLSSGAKINYEYSIVGREENVSRTIEESCISKRYITQPNSSTAEQITTYEYDGNERIINEPGGKIITQTYRNKKGYIEYQKEEYPDKDYTIEKNYRQIRDCEGLYKPTQIITTETSGNNEITVTETYSYSDSNLRKTTETTRDGVLISVESYKGKLLEYSRNKRADNEWICTENTIENGRIVNSTYCLKNDSGTKLATGYSNTYTYDTTGDLSSSTVDGVTTNYTYVYGDYSSDESPQYSVIVTKTIPSVGNVIDSTGAKVTADITEVAKYDAFGNVVESVDANGNVTQYSYDKLSRPTATIYPNNTTETVEYNDLQNTVTVTDRAGKITVLSYDGVGNNVSADIYAGSQQYTQYTKEYDDNGRLTKYTIYESDEPITEVLYEYYSNGEVKAERVYDADTDTLMSEQLQMSNEITETPERVTTTTIKKSDSENLVVKQYFDIYGIPTKSTAGNNDSSTVMTETYSADLLGNILSLTDSENHTTTYTYDYLNRVTKETTTKGSYIYTYTDAYLTRTTDREDNRATYEYDTRGICTTQTDATSRYTKSYFDPMGNLCRTEVGKDDTCDVTEYRYDNMNNLIYVITHPTADTSEVIKYTYDNVGNCTSMITGLTSVDETVNPQIHSVTTYAYDINGNCISETDPLGNTKTASYNTLGYVTSETDRTGQSATYTYDALMRQEQYSKGNASVGYTYDHYGNVISMVDLLGQVSYNYDVLGNLLSETRGTESNSYTYNSLCNRLTMDITSDDYTRNYIYSYNTAGWLDKIVSDDIKLAYNYDSEGHITKIFSQQYALIKLTTQNTYDNAYRLTSIANTPTGKSKVTRNASYNYSGNLVSTSTSAGSVTYTYDGAGRLLTEKVGTELTTYTYDFRGNRISKVSPTETVTYTYDLANKLLSMTKTSGETTTTTTYTYDLNGNLILKQCGSDTVAYTYNSLGQLESITDSAAQITATYTYDGNNLRKSKTVTSADGTAVTTKYIYDGTLLVAEVVDEDNYKGYMYANGASYLTVMVTPTKNYFLNNNILHDIEKVTSDSGKTVQETGFDAFGNKCAIAGTELCPVGYRGEYHDAESGLIYLHNRYYDPEIGRFITEDPIKDGSNWYVYCENDPINRRDPHGTASFEEICDAIFQAGPFDAMSINNIGDDALEAAENYALEKGLTSVTDNIADAYRHFAWNYDSVRKGVPVEDVMQVTTNHEVLTQKYMGKDSNGTKYYKVALSSLMDLQNNKIGRFQATLYKNKGKASREVFEYLASHGGVVTSLEHTKRIWGIKEEWLYTGKEGIRGEVSVLIKNGLKENALNIIVVNKNEVELK